MKEKRMIGFQLLVMLYFVVGGMMGATMSAMDRERGGDRQSQMILFVLAFLTWPWALIKVLM
jgi:hypothetical protein